MQDLAISHQKELGEHGIPIFLRMLRSEDVRDDEIVEAVLKCLFDLLEEVDDDVPPVPGQKKTAQCLRNAEVILADPRNIELLLDLLLGTGAQSQKLFALTAFNCICCYCLSETVVNTLCPHPFDNLEYCFL